VVQSGTCGSSSPRNGKHRRSIAVRYGLLMDGHDCMSKSVDGGRTQRVQP
jgi:hypothetical protein